MAEDLGGSAFPDTELMSAEADKGNFSETETSRMKLQVSAEASQGDVERQYHHGRCDVGSPWAKGESFDVLE